MKTLKDYEYFSTDLGVLYHGKAEIILPLIKDKVDMVLTSPPYDDLRNYEGFDFNFEKTAKGLHNIICRGGTCVWIVGDATHDGSESGTSFYQAFYFKKTGFKLHDTMIWKKRKAPQDQKRYEPEFEYMFIFVNGILKTFNPITERRKSNDKRIFKGFHREKNNEIKYSNIKEKKDMVTIGNIWEINNRDRIDHPAFFPLKLAKNHIYTWSNKNDVVMDPFFGSGTSGLACEKLNRRWIGIEISEKYCEIAKKRIKAEADQFKMEFNQ